MCPRDGLCNQLLVNLRGEGVRRASIWDILIFSISRLSRQEAKSVCWWAGMNYETTHVGWEVARSWGSVATSVYASGWGRGHSLVRREDPGRTDGWSQWGCGLRTMGPLQASQILGPKTRWVVGSGNRRGPTGQPPLSAGLEGDTVPS